MDRRQKKTKDAIFDAFAGLLAEKNYSQITVQEIIDAANVGRSTFYAHFETKDFLLEQLCEELFDHITNTAMGHHHEGGRYSCGSAEDSVFLHLLRHLQENDRNILGLLSSQNNEIFMRYFKSDLKKLVLLRFGGEKGLAANPDLPEDYVVNHISASFVETVGWWLSQKNRQSPEKIARIFLAVVEPLLPRSDSSA